MAMENLRPLKRQRLASALALMPMNALWELQKIFQDKTDSTALPSGAFKRAAKAVYQPSRSCYEKLTVKLQNGGHCFFFAGLLQKMLVLLLTEISWWKQRFASLAADAPLDLVLYADECTGGNVLCTASSKKIYFFYIGIKQMGELHRANAWLPWAAVPARDMRDIDGGFSSVVCSILLHLKNQGLEGGLDLGGSRYRFRISSFVGDMDSVRLLCSAKGASALKPCLWCQNLVSKGSLIPESDNYFVTISSSQVEKFDLLRSQELFEAYDRSLREKATRTKKDHSEVEKHLGFLINEHSLIASPEARAILPLDRIVTDSCHNYFANGVASQELLLLQQHLKEHGTTLDHIKQSAIEVQWVCSNDHFCSRTSRSFLFYESLWPDDGDMFKGGAQQVWCLIPLLHFYAHQLAPDLQSLAMKSFRALYLVAQLESFTSRFLIWSVSGRFSGCFMCPMAIFLKHHESSLFPPFFPWCPLRFSLSSRNSDMDGAVQQTWTLNKGNTRRVSLQHTQAKNVPNIITDCTCLPSIPQMAISTVGLENKNIKSISSSMLTLCRAHGTHTLVL